MPTDVEVPLDRGVLLENAFSNLARFAVERNYVELGCHEWNTRKVLLLMAKFGDTRTVMAARMRVKGAEFERRMKTDTWTAQDGLILTFLEREINILKGGIPPAGSMINPTPL